MASCPIERKCHHMKTYELFKDRVAYPDPQPTAEKKPDHRNTTRSQIRPI